MATTITMPQLGETVTEGTVAQWLKKVGDSVEKYEAFVEVSTDKVNAEVPSPVSGTIRALLIKEGETVPTGAPIAIIDEVGAATVAPAAHAPSPSEQVAAAATAGTPAPTMGNGKPSNGSSTTTGDGLLRSASPAVRRLAREHSVDVSGIRGTGTNGRITARDIVAAANAGPSAAGATSISADNAEYVARTPAATATRPTYAQPLAGQLIPLTQARKIIADRKSTRLNSSHLGISYAV